MGIPVEDNRRFVVDHHNTHPVVVEAGWCQEILSERVQSIPAELTSNLLVVDVAAAEHTLSEDNMFDSKRHTGYPPP